MFKKYWFYHAKVNNNDVSGFITSSFFTNGGEVYRELGKKLQQECDTKRLAIISFHKI